MFWKTISLLFIENILCDTGNETDPLMRANRIYRKHPSILRITKSFKYHLSFVPVDKDIKAKNFINLDPKKVASQDDIPG